MAPTVTGARTYQAPLKLRKPSENPSLSSNGTLFTPDPNTLDYIRLDYSDEVVSATSNSLLQYLTIPKAPRATVRTLSITGSVDRETWTDWTLFVNTLQLLSLSELYWTIEIVIPYEIIRILEEMTPPCRLYYTTSYNSKRDEQMWEEAFGMKPKYESGLKSLVDSPILYALRTHISYGRSSNLESMKLLFQILSNSTTLRELDLSLNHFGCVFGGGQPYAFDFASQPEVTFTPLEVLRLSGYRLDESSNGGKAWEYRDIWNDGERIEWLKNWSKWVSWPVAEGMMELKMSWRFQVRQFEGWWYKRPVDGRTSLDCWLQAMDWSKLHTLSLNRPSDETLVKLNGTRLPSLTNLTIIRGYESASDTILNFVAGTAQPLTYLSLRNLNLCSTDPLILALSNHSKSLTSLSIHNPDSSNAPQNDTRILEFAGTCPFLHYLEIDMHIPSINGTLKEYIENTYRTFVTEAVSLKELVLHFPLPDLPLPQFPPSYLGDTESKEEMSDHKRKPHIIEDEINESDEGPVVLAINLKVVETLFAYLSRRKERVERLVIFVGDWERGNSQSYIAPKFRNKFTRYICEQGKGCEIMESGAWDDEFD